MFRIPKINQCVKNFLRLRKVEFSKWINLINVLFIGFVKQQFSAYQPILCLVYAPINVMPEGGATGWGGDFESLCEPHVGNFSKLWTYVLAPGTGSLNNSK